jgi:hypothetical protein
MAMNQTHWTVPVDLASLLVVSTLSLAVGFLSLVLYESRNSLVLPSISTSDVLTVSSNF